MSTYRAQDLANRIINTEPIFGVNSQAEKFLPTATYAYSVGGSNWSALRGSVASSINTYFNVINSNDGAGRFTLARTGVQYDAALTFTPIGSYLDINIDTITLPQGATFKIRAYKGRPQALGGDPGELRIPANTGYTPYSNELIIDENTTRATLYLNSLATNDLIARAGKLNLFILGEWDYNNVSPSNVYEISYLGVNPNMTLTVFD
jgi:hypothetical protein